MKEFDHLDATLLSLLQANTALLQTTIDTQALKTRDLIQKPELAQFFTTQASNFSFTSMDRTNIIQGRLRILESIDAIYRVGNGTGWCYMTREESLARGIAQ